MFILLLGVGYLFATVLLYSSVAKLDGRPGISAEDIRIKYYGNRTGSRLENALNTVMKEYHSKEEHETLVSWIHAGATKEGFESRIKPIVTNSCVKCHSPESGMNAPNISTYEAILPLVQIDTGESVTSLVRVSHIHLFGLGMIFYLMGRMFLLVEINVTVKRIMVVIPFLAIGVDIGSWWFTKYTQNTSVFSYSVIIGGTLMGLSFAFQSFLTLYQMWLYKSANAVERRSESRRG